MSVQGADVATYRRCRERLAARVRSRRPALARGAARPLVPLGQADPRSGRRGLCRSRGARRRRERGPLAGPRMLSHRAAGPGRGLAPDRDRAGRQGRRLAAARPARGERSRRSLRRPGDRASRSSNGAATGVPLPSTGEPIRAGDVMVLLPRRGILQELLIRHLKQLQVPVAGADRLALTDEIAVCDLIALGDALLLPEDDLSLAAVLRSPLFGLSEEALFELAYDRGGATLYERLRAARDRPPFAEAHTRALRSCWRRSISCRRSSSMPGSWAKAAAASACSPASARRRTSRSKPSSPRRSRSSRATRPRCRRSCTGCGPTRPS